MCTMGEVLSPLLIQGITEKNELKNLSRLKKIIKQIAQKGKSEIFE